MTIATDGRRAADELYRVYIPFLHVEIPGRGSATWSEGRLGWTSSDDLRTFLADRLAGVRLEADARRILAGLGRVTAHGEDCF